MPEDDPDLTTLYARWQRLMALHRNYPDDATGDERGEYFAAAAKQGLETHRGLGLDEAEALEKIGLSAGVSGAQLKMWIEKRSSIDPHFHRGALLAQASLVFDHINACQAALARIKSHLDADDWRSELGAFDHLKAIGLKTLVAYGGPFGKKLSERLASLDDPDPSVFKQDMRRMILCMIAEALTKLIGEAPDAAEDEEALSESEPADIILN